MRTVICLFVCFCLTSVSGAATIKVDLNGGADYTDIQSALDAAMEGDIIQVAPGTYIENITINKAVTLQPTVPGQVTVFSTTNSGTVITVNAGATLKDLVVTGANSGTGISVSADEATISGCEPHTLSTAISGSGNKMTISECKIHTVSNGISTSGRDVTITGCDILGGWRGINISGSHGGGIQIDQCRIHESSNGIRYSEAGCTVTVTRTEIYDCSSYGIKGGVSSEITNELFISNSIIHHNSDHGIIVHAYAYAHVTTHGKKTTRSSYGEATITHCVIYGNTEWGIWEETARASDSTSRYSTSASATSKVFVQNCIVAKNGSGGVHSQHSGARSMYSCYWDNGSSGVSHYDGGIQNFIGDIESDPRFVDPENADLHLRSDSPSIDAGKPGLESNDVDGSRSDMGAYGGPNPFAGKAISVLPIVSDVTVEPNPVEHGNTITIRAKSAVR